MPDAPDDYAALLDEGRALFPGMRLGRPGRARTYWLTIALMRVLRLRWRVRVTGAEHVGPGAAVLVGNHVSGVDPVVVVIRQWWRCTAFTKVEVFQRPGAFFFRWMGQIPLRRGDEAATSWALRMAARTLADGGFVALYPEGTRSPDATALHKLHKRVLVPVLQGSPDVPVHAVTTSYAPARWGRVHVDVRVSPPLAADRRALGAQELTDAVRDALLALGGQTYVDEYARDVKRARREGTPPAG